MITKKPYPSVLDNPFQIRGKVGTSKWEIIDRQSRQCVGVYPDSNTAYDARRVFLRNAGYNV